MNIILVHIGTVFPIYMIDNIFQLLYMSLNEDINIKIYIIISDALIQTLNDEIKKLNSDNTDIISIIKESDLRSPGDDISKYMLDHFREYRDNFWNATTTRFYYLAKFMEKYLPNDENIVHIETDVLLYNLNFLNKLTPLDKNEIYMVKDHEYRVVPSIIIYKNAESADSLAKHITNFLFENKHNTDKEKPMWYNDMHILSQYKYIKKLPYTLSSNSSIIFDGASIGQYLCGVDPKNIDIPKDIPENLKQQVELLKVYNNPRMKFINETFQIMSNSKIERTDNGNYVLKNSTNSISADIINLHIHSKQLWTVNYTNTLTYKDIITGDRILEGSNISFTTPLTEAFHKDLQEYIKICVQLPLKFTNDHKNLIENAIINASGSSSVFKIFIYSNYISSFAYLLKKIYINLDVHLYLHNSDDHIEQETVDILDSISYIKKVYCQNFTLKNSDKFKVLPIGLANRMYPHGSVLDLCQVIEETYKHRRTKNLYVQMSNTHIIRSDILSYIKNYNNSSSNKFIIQEPVPYKEYLKELACHYFALCPRGNGIDTHRFWESLYLGVIPIVFAFSKEDTIFYENLKELTIPFFIITDLDQLTPDIFNKELYEKYITEFGPIQTLKGLKLSSFIDE